ncbi:MAG: acyl-CoA dehydrogenase family protein [Syntrophomonadaceae bacterium]
MSFVLDEEQQLIQQNARDFALKYIEPYADQVDRESFFPREVVQQLAENDFMGFYLPEEFGGAEAGYLNYVIGIEEIAKVSAGVAAILVNHASLAAYTINKWGTTQQKQNYLTAMCKGEKLGTFALNEPGAAPGVGPNRVLAVKDGDNYILNGRKTYIANGAVADIYIVFGVTDEKQGPKGMSAFIVDANSEGISVVRNIGKMGLRGCPWAEIAFNNVKVSADNLIGVEGKGLAMAKEAKGLASISEGALVVGVIQAAMEDASEYAKQRIQFGQPIANFPAIQNMLAEMATNVHIARLAIYHAADLIDKEEPAETEAAMVKLFINRISQSSMADAIQIEGGYGYSEDMMVSRYFREVKGVLLSDSSIDFPEQTIAKELLG